METYSTFDIVNTMGIKRSTLQDWINRGFIIPNIKASGVGTRAKFTEKELILIKIFNYLITRVDRKDAATIIKKIGNLKLKDLEQTYISVIRKRNKGYVVKPYYHMIGATGVIKFDPSVETMIFIDYSSFKKSTLKSIKRL